jgi:protein phosphatase 2C family protein 2/3
LTSCLRRYAGIWDCLSSQQVVDFVRFKVSEGKSLTEISEMMCDHCLAPDTSSGAGIGCDNMTVLIVAILGGRTKEEWYSWVTDRVKQNYGYQTPATVPQIYAQSRLMAFKARREAQEERDRMRAEREDAGGSAFGGFARVLGSTGGITFHPAGGISGGGLMFGDDSDEDDSDEDEMDGVEGGRSFFSDTLGIGGPRSPDATSSLKAQLDDFEKEIRDDDFDGDKHRSDGDEEKVDGLGTQDLPEGALPETVQIQESQTD